jgi:hypothetical protein
MAFQPFTSFGTFAKAVLPNASNSATVTVPATAVPQAVSAPVAPVMPTTPVVASGPTKPITGTVVAPAVDTALRGAHSTWEGALAALLVAALALVGVHLPVAATVVITGLLTGLAAVARSILARKTGAKAIPKP